MSEEEKKAIEEINKYTMYPEQQEYLNIILNLIEKQKKENRKIIGFYEEQLFDMQKKIEELKIEKEYIEECENTLTNDYILIGETLGLKIYGTQKIIEKIKELKEMSIPKLKIDEKIKELEKQVEVEDGIGLRYSEKGKIYAQIRILKELKENKE